MTNQPIFKVSESGTQIKELLKTINARMNGVDEMVIELLATCTVDDESAHAVVGGVRYTSNTHTRNDITTIDIRKNGKWFAAVDYDHNTNTYKVTRRTEDC